jgi:hypothetical protein
VPGGLALTTYSDRIGSARVLDDSSGNAISRTPETGNHAGRGSMTEGLDGRELSLLAYLFCNHFTTTLIDSVSS